VVAVATIDIIVVVVEEWKGGRVGGGSGRKAKGKEKEKRN